MSHADEWNARKRVLKRPDGRRLAYVDSGGLGPVWLLIHGYSDTSRSFSPLVPGLSSFRLIIPDLPGHGASDAPARPGLEGLAEDMRALVSGLRLSPRLVAGHSLGSLVTLALAASGAFPAAKMATLAGTACPMLEGADFLDAVPALSDPPDEADGFFRDWYAGPKPLDPAFIACIRREAAAMPRAVWLAYRDMLQRADLRPLLQGIGNPVLGLSGSEDPLFSAAHADLLARSIPRFRDLRLAGHGHNPHWEDPAAIAAILTDFAG